MKLVRVTEVPSETSNLKKPKHPEEITLFQLPAIANGYFLLSTLGRGSYGVVQLCLKIDTKEMVALKVVSNDVGQKELEVLEKLKKLGQDENNLVRFNGHYAQGDKLLLEFEKLDMTIQEFVKISGDKGLPLSEIQVITRQMLVALNALKSVQLVHSDIKPNNIMLVNHLLQPLRLKLIDFGMTTPVSDMKTGSHIQILNFRAPEVMLGLPLDEAVDMWALGCNLAYMYLSTNMYKGNCEYQAMKSLVQLCGLPNYEMLNSGKYTKKFFTKRKVFQRYLWKLKEQCNCAECRVPLKKKKSAPNKTNKPDGAAASASRESRQFASIDEIAFTRPDVAQNEDTQAFLSLLKQMLHLDAKKRITPGQALQHPFLSLKEFPSDSVSNPDLSSAQRTRLIGKGDACKTEMKNVTAKVSKSSRSRKGKTPKKCAGKRFFKRIRSCFKRLVPPCGRRDDAD